MRHTIHTIAQYKARGERIAMLTAYDHATARLLDDAGIPLLLVGDSLGMVVLGYDSTLPVTLDDILHHTRAVVRGTRRALVVADLPFMTYQVSPEEALRNAGRLLAEGGCQAVKLEGGATMAPTVRRLVEAGIPVMGHLGLTPQSVNQLGGYRAQGKTAAAAQRLLDDALALQDAGAFALVLEVIPAEVAATITATLRIPTIGIGAGAGCDGQVQVINDILGLSSDYLPRHARAYASLATTIRQAAEAYRQDVESGSFPTAAQSVTAPAGLAEGLTSRSQGGAT